MEQDAFLVNSKWKHRFFLSCFDVTNAKMKMTSGLAFCSTFIKSWKNQFIRRQRSAGNILYGDNKISFMFANLCTFFTQFKSLKIGDDWFLLARDFLLAQISLNNFPGVRFQSTILCFRCSTGLDLLTFSDHTFLCPPQWLSHCIWKQLHSNLPDPWRDVCSLSIAQLFYPIPVENDNPVSHGSING